MDGYFEGGFGVEDFEVSSANSFGSTVMVCLIGVHLTFLNTAIIAIGM